MPQRFLAFVILMILLASTAGAATLLVPTDFPTIQAGVNAATVGDTVLLDPGIYFGEGNRDIDFGGKDLTVLSRDNDPSTCTIACQGQYYENHRGFIFQSGETSQSRLQGLTIRDGWGEGDPYEPSGGGGAILCENGSSPVIANCRLTQCVTRGSGGGLSAHDSSPTLVDCRIDHNQCSSYGGGVYASGSGTITLSGCQIANGNGSVGGGAYLVCEEPLVFECVVANNSDIGLYLGESGTILNTTVTGNDIGIEGGCCYLENSLITFNGMAFGESIANDFVDGCADLLCSNVFGNSVLSWVSYFEFLPGTSGNISANPLYCDADNWDYHLAPDSPCLNTMCGRMGAMGEGTCPALSPVLEGSELAFGLRGNFPNPFNPRTEIAFALGEASVVRLEIFDLAGRKVRTLIDSTVFQPGEHQARWEGRDEAGRQAAAGVYFSLLTTPHGTDSRRMVLLK